MTIDESSFSSVIAFSNELAEQELRNDKYSLIKTIEFLNSFDVIYRKEKRRIPYQINIIDELRANENAHSRILGMLLRHKELDGGGNMILKSFIDYIIDKNNDKKYFSEIKEKIKNPQITVEKSRIDIWIKERKKYAIIIENKVYNATDQDRQIERYIEVTKEEGYKEENIYLLYLPPTYEKEPEERSWGTYKNSEIRKKRYLKLSFRDDILPWLKTYVLPNARVKEKLLLSSLEQYIDYLEGKFSLRRINNKMNMKLQEFIKEELKITKAEPEVALKEVLKKESDVRNAMNQLSQLRDSISLECFQKWEKSLKENYPNLNIIGNCSKLSPDHTQVGVKIDNGDISFSLLIEYHYNNKIYYGIGKHYATNEMNNNLDFTELIDDLNFKTTTDWWYGWKYTSFENAYSRLTTLIDKVVNKKQYGIIEIPVSENV